MAIYLDHAATTPLRREALDAMLPLLGEQYGNPSSVHAYGRAARAALDEARERFAAPLNAETREIIFTAGGTEAINLAVKGVAWAGKARGTRLVTSGVEHHAVMHALRHLEKFGFEVVTLPVDRYGRVDPEQLDAAINDRTILVSLLMANNEVGTVQPLTEVIRRVRSHRGVAIHLDAVQAAPYMAIDTRELDVDLISFSAHKFEGPKGIGALYLRHGTILLPQLHGGAQERYRRAGTENVAGAAGMAVAYELARAEQAETAPRIAALRDRLRDAILALPNVELTGHPRKRLPGHLSVIVRDTEGEDLVMSLDLVGVAASTGAACTTGSTEPSHVLTALGFPDEEARGSLRISLGRTTTDEEIDAAVTIVPQAISALRASTALTASDALGEQVGA
ncbi:MAG TPA: cysteine desulfurase family protein [Candidatus Limnocylindrales bacterium]|nr:cysteine desulfurase family protein [Candidatus Limnocylindrales bacterium]